MITPVATTFPVHPFPSILSRQSFPVHPFPSIGAKCNIKQSHCLEAHRDKDLPKMLQEMGMKLAFDPVADFRGISPRSPLYVNTVIHKAFIGDRRERHRSCRSHRGASYVWVSTALTQGLRRRSPLPLPDSRPQNRVDLVPRTSRESPATRIRSSGNRHLGSPSSARLERCTDAFLEYLSNTS